MASSLSLPDITLVQFWDKMEELLNVDFLNESEVNSALVSFIKISADHYKDIVKTDQDLYRIGLMLVESPMFVHSSDFCLRKLLSLLSIDLLELNLKLIIAYVILYKCKIDLHSLDTLLENQGFTVLYNNIYSNFAYLSKYGDDNKGMMEIEVKSETEVDILEEIKHLTTILIDMLYQFFKYSKCEISSLQIIDDFFIYFLMKSLRSDVIDDTFNNVKFKLLLALNEQYMIFACDYDIENKVYEFLLNQTMSKNFIGLLLLKFNRETDTTILIMICKIIYIVLTKNLSIARNFFYLNDLNVFVDVLLRNLTNISEDEEILRNTYLRVFEPLLNNSELSATHYHKSEILETLKYLSSVDNFCSNNVATIEQKTTARLAMKCLEEVTWLGYEKNSSSESNESEESRRSSLSIGSNNTNLTALERKSSTSHLYGNIKSSYSADSINRRSSLPPPPPPSRKYKHIGGRGQKIAVAKLGQLEN